MALAEPVGDAVRFHDITKIDIPRGADEAESDLDAPAVVEVLRREVGRRGWQKSRAVALVSGSAAEMEQASQAMTRKSGDLPEQDTTTKGGGPCGARLSRPVIHADARVPCPSKQMKKGRAMTITVYSKPACVQCTATTRALEARGLSFDVIDLTADDAAFSHVSDLGYRQVPVVVAGDDHWAGFRPDLIGRLS